MSLTTSTNGNPRSSLGSAYPVGRDDTAAVAAEIPASPLQTDVDPLNRISPELRKSLSEVRGQAQFLLYLADQIEDSLDQLGQEGDDCQAAFLCKVLSMYSSQLETKHQGLGDKIAETCQEVYVTVREFDASV
ncbi:MAG: hypothetical protein SFX72_17540 [Isosphaeraceae bacterium]|nr:hypothetical protein [Isosphaeraceae bacterium]